MPYAEIYRTKDGKWHMYNCDLLTVDTDSGEHQTIGSKAEKPDPPRDQMCRKCWACLFRKENQGGRHESRSID